MALKPGCNCGFVDIIDMSYPQVVYRFMGGLVCVVWLIVDLPLCVGGFWTCGFGPVYRRRSVPNRTVHRKMVVGTHFFWIFKWVLKRKYRVYFSCRTHSFASSVCRFVTVTNIPNLSLFIVRASSELFNSDPQCPLQPLIHWGERMSGLKCSGQINWCT